MNDDLTYNDWAFLLECLDIARASIILQPSRHAPDQVAALLPASRKQLSEHIVKTAKRIDALKAKVSIILALPQEADIQNTKQPVNETKQIVSWAPEVLVQGKWNRNQLRFATRKEALDWAKALHLRWTACMDARAVETTDIVNAEG